METFSKNQDQYRMFFERSTDAFLIIEDTIFIDCNEATVKMLHYENKEDILNTHPSELSPVKQSDGSLSYQKADEMIAVAFKNGSHRFEWDHKRANGEIFPVEVLLTVMPEKNKNVLHVVWRDITERKRLERKLFQKQKMEAIGALAGGIAHDFNNILSIILGNAELIDQIVLRKSFNMHGYIGKSEMGMHEYIECIIGATHRAKELVKQILIFSREEESEKAPIDLQALIHEELNLLRASIPTTVQIVEKIDHIGHIFGDKSKIRQVILNLCTNAFQSMGRNPTGTLVLESEDIRMRENDRKVVGEQLEPGVYIKLKISDTGSGIEKGVLAKIFDQYFTTKKHLNGTGLGLALVHRIVKEHGGYITVYSEPDIGTTFTLYLPKITEHQTTSSTKVRDLVRGGAENILFVDDETEICDIQLKILEGFGYKVKAISNSMEALKYFTNNMDMIDIVITDMTMPHITGLELSKQILSMKKIPIILCTGFSDVINKQEIADIGIKYYLNKPFSKNEMAKLIRKACDNIT